MELHRESLASDVEHVLLYPRHVFGKGDKNKIGF
jgi:hypothetical protein